MERGGGGRRVEAGWVGVGEAEVEGGREQRSERREEDRETERGGWRRECLSSEQNVVIYLVAAKQIRRLPVL